MCISQEGYDIKSYGVASISRLLKIIGLFCKSTLQKILYSAKETYHFKEPTNRSHPIGMLTVVYNVCIHVYARQGTIWGGYD